MWFKKPWTKTCDKVHLRFEYQITYLNRSTTTLAKDKNKDLNISNQNYVRSWQKLDAIVENKVLKKIICRIIWPIFDAKNDFGNQKLTTFGGKLRNLQFSMDSLIIEILMYEKTSWSFLISDLNWNSVSMPHLIFKSWLGSIM